MTAAVHSAAGKRWRSEIRGFPIRAQVPRRRVPNSGCDLCRKDDGGIQSMQTITTINEMQAAARRLHQQRKRIGFVPTMGALHDGHLSLIRACRRECDIVVVSVFVNPLQFGPSEDFARYPRDLSKDSEFAAGAGTDIVFAPSAENMYPAGFRTHVEVDDLSTVSKARCGRGTFSASRPSWQSSSTRYTPTSRTSGRRTLSRLLSSGA